MKFWKDLYIEIVNKNLNNHPLDLNACEYICKIINQNNFTKMLEIGTGYGFSSYYFAKNSNIKCIDTIEKNTDYYIQAKKLDDTNKIKYINESIFDYLIKDSYDLIFVDGPKTKQELIIDKVKNHLNINGMIIIDNIYLKRVVNKTNNNAIKLINKHKEFINYLNNLKEFNVEYIDIDDGLAILRRR